MPPHALHVTQPTASAQLKELTEAIGLPLHEVISRRVHLTDAGRSLAQTARAMMMAWEAFEQHVDQVKGLSRGRLRIAAVSTAKYFIPRLVGNFCKLHPAIDVSLEVLNRDGVVARLKENLDEIYIMSMPPDFIDLEDEVFMENPLVLIAARSAFSQKACRASLADLKGQRFILREPGSGTRMATDQHFRKHRFTPDVRLELGSNEAIKEAVAGGLGLGVDLAPCAQRHGRPARHQRRSMIEGFPISSRWHVVHPQAPSSFRPSPRLPRAISWSRRSAEFSASPCGPRNSTCGRRCG